MSEVREVIEGAIELIDRPYGWIKNKEKSNNMFGTGVTGYCAIGALEASAAMLDYPLDVAVNAEILIIQKIYENYPEYSGGLPLFNDDKKRTKKEVIAMFEKAAVDCLD